MLVLGYGAWVYRCTALNFSFTQICLELGVAEPTARGYMSRARQVMAMDEERRQTVGIEADGGLLCGARAFAEAGRTARYAADHIDLTGLPAFAESVTEEVLEACSLLDTAKKLESSAEQRAAAVRTLLTFAADEEAEVGLTRLAPERRKFFSYI